MLDLDNPPPDAPAMTTVAAGALEISIADAGISNSVDGGPRKARSRMEDRPLLTDDLIRGIITDGDHLPNLVRDGTAAGTVGFAFRRSKRDFVLRYTSRAGIERLFRIGPWPRWNTERARKRANEILVEVDKGADPVGDEHARRAAPTVAELVETFAADHIPSLAATTQTAYRQQLRDYILPGIGRKRVDDVEHADALAIVNKIARAGNKPLANRVQGLAHALFDFARRLGVRVKPNPFSDVRRNEEHPRHRYLDEAELGRLLAALADERHDPDGARAIKLLLLTGARRNEVLTARWCDLDLSKGKWTKPAHATKQNRAHHAPLNGPALKLLGEIKDEQTAGYRRLPAHVFAGTGTFARIGKLARTWRRVCKRAQLANLRLHDLRHAYASFVASGGASLLVIGELLGHRSAATTRRYAHMLDNPLREATEKVGAMIAAAEPAAPSAARPPQGNGQMKGLSFPEDAHKDVGKV